MNPDDKLEMFFDRWFTKLIVVAGALGLAVFIVCVIVIVHFLRQV